MTNKKKRKRRLRKARVWYPQQHFTENSDVIKAYQQKFNVDPICATKEVYMLQMFSPEKQKMYDEEMEERQSKRKKRKTQKKAAKKKKNKKAVKPHTRKQRLAEARIWYPQQHFTEDSHGVKACRVKFGVDRICAMKELCMLHMLSYEKQKLY